MSLKSKLYNIIIDDKTVQGKRFDILIMILIVISLITFPLETLKIDNDLFFQILYFSEIYLENCSVLLLLLCMGGK